MATEPVSYDGIAAQLLQHGLALRGGFHPTSEDVVPGDIPFGAPNTLLLVGVVGGMAWQTFDTHRRQEEHPLDAWTKRVVDEVASSCGGFPVYPNDKPFWPFQQWAQRCETLYQSPLGLLIHPDYGLWHAYRAAILFTDRFDLPAKSVGLSPCETCADKPCLSGCPVDAFSPGFYDVPVCADHLRGQGRSTCLETGCQARNACPAGTDFRYSDPQLRFHMAAFNRSVNGL